MKESTLPKLLRNAYFMIAALIFVVLNITVAGTTFFYSANVEQLVYRETFRHLEVTRDVKHHALQLYFSDHYAHLLAFAKSEPVSNLVRIFRGSGNGLSETWIDSVTRYRSDSVPMRALEGNRLEESMAVYGFQKAMLIDDEHADILFSTDPEATPGRSLAEEPFLRTPLYGLWERTVRYKSPQMSDMIRSTGKGAPCICLATPVFDGMELKAVLMVRLPVDGVNEIMHYRSGMGRTEESYAVGEDHLMRSDSYLDPEHYSVSASFAAPGRGRVDTEAVSAALQGKEGHGVIVDYRALPVFSAYRPLNLDGFVWAVVSEIDKSEVADKIDELKMPIYLVAAALYAVITLMSYFVVRRIIALAVVEPLKASYRRTESFRQIIEKSLNEIYLFRPSDLYFTFINRGAARNTGYTSEEMQRMRLPALPCRMPFLWAENV